MFKKIIDNLRWLIKGEKNSENREVLKETLKEVKQEKKDEIYRQKESKKELRKLQKIRGYWNKESNIRAEKINNIPKLTHFKNFKEYKLENKSNAKTLETFFDRIKSRILEILELNKKVIYTLSVHLSKLNSLKNREIQEFHFVKPVFYITNEEELEKSYESIYDFFITKISEEMLHGSGWQLKSIDSLQVKLMNYSPLRGGLSVDLPDKLKNSNSILHFRNNDEYCLAWALIYGAFSGNTKIDKTLKMNSKHFVWDDMYAPASGHDIKAFERNNAFSVFSYGLGENKYYIYYRGNRENEELNILFYENHFFPVKDEKIFHKYLFKSKKCFVCKICLNNFRSEDLLEEHNKYCQKEYKCKINYPKSGNIFFKKHSATMFHPISFYMDIEAKLIPIDESAGPKTRKYQKHEFLYLGLYEVNRITGKNVYKVFSDLKEFSNYMYDYEEELSKQVEIKKKQIPKIPKEKFPKNCDYCNNLFDEENIPVIHHCHFTGKFLGIVHKKCNLLLRKNYFIPVFCHNLMGYDEKFIIRQFSFVEIIARNLENFISFRVMGRSLDITFIDSMKFLNSSLEKIVENLNGNIPFTKQEIGNISGKGIFPYDYITDESVLDERKLPERKYFFSKLHNKECSEEDYLIAEKMWDFFQCETLRDYLLGYLKSDTILLADCVENFRKLSFDMFGLDPAHYFSLPSLSFDCFLKTSEISLEKITNPTIYNFIERGIKGGESFIAKRYAKANNKYMKDYNPAEKSSFLGYFDGNSLYPTNMKKDLPYKNFRFLEKEKIETFDWENNLCFMDVEISIPENLHDYFKDYPLFPEHIDGKLVGNLHPKKSYICLSEYLKTALKYGYTLEKINNIIIFGSKKIMENYITNNVEMRKKAKTDFEKTFWKDLSNIIYGKSIEDVRKRINVMMLKDFGQKYIDKPYFSNIKNIGEKFLIETKKMAVTLDKPIYIGAAILGYAKAFMAEFWYGYLKKKYGDKIQLLMMDTDSFFFEVFTEDFYEDIREDVETYFDTSNFPEDFKTLSGNKIPKINKKVLGKFKDELGGTICTEFVGLRSKQYAFKYGDKITKKCKGVTKDCMRDITFEDYVNVLFGNPLEASMNVIRSENHSMFTETIQKKVLDKFDEKREILDDGIHTVPWGYKHF